MLPETLVEIQNERLPIINQSFQQLHLTMSLMFRMQTLTIGFSNVMERVTNLFKWIHSLELTFKPLAFKPLHLKPHFIESLN